MVKYRLKGIPKQTKSGQTGLFLKLIAIKEGKMKIPKKRSRVDNSAPRKKPIQRERVIQNEILYYLQCKGVIVNHIKTKGSMGSHGQFLKHKNVWRGIPDLLAFYNHQLWFIEVKAEKGYLSKEQRFFQSLCYECNVNHIVARGINDLDPIFEEEK